MIHDKKTMFLRTHVGEAESIDGKFQMSTNIADNSPIIRFPDGRWWTINWQQLLEMAVAEGAKS